MAILSLPPAFLQEIPDSQKGYYQDLLDILNQDGLVQKYGLQTIDNLFFNPNLMYDNDVLLETSLLGKTKSANFLMAHMFIEPNASQQALILKDAFAGFNAQSLRLQTDPGVTIQGWYIAPKDDKPTIIFSTGLNGDILGAQSLLTKLSSNGYGVFTYEYRGFGGDSGGSTGTPTENGLYHDLQKISTLLAKGQDGFQKTGYDQQVLMGYSLGANISIHDAAESHHDYRAVVAIDPVRSIPDAVNIEIKQATPLAQQILQPFQDSVKAAQDKLAGLFDIHHDISHLDAPLLYTEGSKDDLALPDIAKMLFNKANPEEPKQFLTVQNANHYNIVSDPSFATTLAKGAEQFLQQTDFSNSYNYFHNFYNQLIHEIATFTPSQEDWSGESFHHNFSASLPPGLFFHHH